MDYKTYHKNKYMVKTIDNKTINKEELVVGMQIRIATLFGQYSMYIDSINDNYATAYTLKKDFGASLNCKNGLWDSSICFNPNIKVKVEIVS